jgi:hypothetical protein
MILGAMTSLALGLPLAALLAVAGYGVNRLLVVSERKGWVHHPRRWSSTGIGNALLELHVALEPQHDRIEMRLVVDEEDEERVGDGRPELPKNVIFIDFVQKRRR